MRRISIRLLSQIYTPLVLLTAGIILPGLDGWEGIPYAAIALVMLIVILFTIIRPQSPGLMTAFYIAVIFLIPVLVVPLLNHSNEFSPSINQLIAVSFSLPVFCSLDHYLKIRASHLQVFTDTKYQRKVTHISISLFITSLVMMMLAPVVNNLVLLFSSIFLLIYLLGALVISLVLIPRFPLSADKLMKRVIAGTAGSASVDITSKTRMSLHAFPRPSVSWLQVTPLYMTISRSRIRLNLNFTPVLAGESSPKIHISITDPRGLFQVNQSIEPLLLHVIPRAKYAEWLAKKYLEQTGSGVISTTNLISQEINKLKRGIEYLENRTYQPGDQLRDIDWKHTLKLSQLIVREYQEAEEQAAIIAVNLSVTDAEAADNLAFNLITAALTLAKENIPTALTAYNHETVILCTDITDPMEMLRNALSIVREITVVNFNGRYLEPTSIAKIRRTVKQLKQADSEPARRLMDILNFEHHFLEETAKSHPATLALSTVTRQVPAPAMILLVSQLNHDAQAILVTAEKLARRQFTTMPVISI